MPSLQSRIMKIVIKRQNLFSAQSMDPIAFRKRAELLAGNTKARRGVKVTPVQAGSVPAEWLVPQGAPGKHAILYIHGGAWFMCSPGTHRTMVSQLAWHSGVRTLSIAYRLAPEHPFPAALEDCRAAYEWLLSSGFPPEGLIVAGDSAGGNLALALLVLLRDAGRPLPAGAACFSPATDLAASGESYRTRRQLDPYFSNLSSGSLVRDYIGDHDPREALISPLYADLRGLPPLLLHVGDHEILLDDSVQFAARARVAGVDARLTVWEGMFHVFQIYYDFLPEGRRSVRQAADFIKERLEVG